MSEAAFDAGAPAPGLTATVVPAAVAVLATAVALPAAALGLLGIALMTAGVRRGTRRYNTAGGALLFGGVLFAAAAGAPPAISLVGGAAAVLAWDAGDHAVGLGQQVGHEAEARRGVLVHVGATGIAAIGIVVLATAVFLLARTGQPGAAAGVLAAAVGLFALVLSR